MEKTLVKTASKMALAALILGIIAVVFSPIPIINNLAFVVGILAILFGIFGLKQTKGNGASGRNKAIAGLVLGALAIVITLISQNNLSNDLNKVSDDLNKASTEINDSVDRSSGKKTDEILKNDLTVVLNKFEVITGEYSTETSLPISITNKLTEKKSYSVKVEAVDATGKRIKDDTVYANDLNGKQSIDVKAFQYIDTDLLDAMKTATFKIVSVTQS